MTDVFEYLLCFLFGVFFGVLGLSLAANNLTKENKHD